MHVDVRTLELVGRGSVRVDHLQRVESFAVVHRRRQRGVHVLEPPWIGFDLAGDLANLPKERSEERTIPKEVRGKLRIENEGVLERNAGTQLGADLETHVARLDLMHAFYLMR